MSYLIILTVAVLSALSLLQRLVPWAMYKNHRGDTFLTHLFDYVAISAFGSLMIENIQSFSEVSLIPLLPALLVAYKSRNVGATVLVAMLAAFVLSVLGF